MSNWIEPRTPLKSCPFCGGKARMLHPKRDCYRVYCSVCGVEIPSAETEEAVTKMWNIGSTCAWISVKDGLPEKDGDYLVGYFPAGGMSVAHYSDNEWATTIPVKVTHWMPMPEKPEIN